MDKMTGKERTYNMLYRKPIDRIPVYEHFWGDTHREWAKNGWVKPDDDFADVFGFDMQECWAFNFVADLDFIPQIIEETEDTKLVRDGNGALLRRHKLHDTTPEHVDFLVKERAAWEEYIKPKLTASPRRINFEGYRKAKEEANKAGRFFMWSGVNVFELMHPVCGHEHMLAGMALDPEWIEDMAYTYSRITVELQEMLFDQEGAPDGLWYYEDMGFKDKPFMSPRMYKELIQPAHKYTIDYAKSKKLPVVMHSCGMVEKLVPGMMEAGIDCLQVIEVKAGMDLLRLYKNFGENLSFMGGIDVRELYSNDRGRIERELEAKIPVVKGNYGYALHSDHSIPFNVTADTFRYFLEYGKKLGSY